MSLFKLLGHVEQISNSEDYTVIWLLQQCNAIRVRICFDRYRDCLLFVLV